MKKEKPQICPKCKGRLFFDGKNGEKTCAKCGFQIKGPDYIPQEKKSSPSMAKSATCPTCGSLAEMTTRDVGGREIYSCAFCGSRFTPTPKEPKIEPVEAPKEAPKEEPKDKPMKGKEIFEMAKGNTLEVYATFRDRNRTSKGTAFFIQDQYIITNAHVVCNYEGRGEIADKIVVNFKGDIAYPAEMVAFNLLEDMALLRVDYKCDKYNKLAAKMPETGEAIYVVGNTASMNMCILEGIVADQLREVDENDYMMISANTVEESAGAPIFNSKGEVVGIATFGEENAAAMNYAIPVIRIREFLDEITDQSGIEF